VLEEAEAVLAVHQRKAVLIQRAVYLVVLELAQQVQKKQEEEKIVLALEVRTKEKYRTGLTVWIL
jgi:hypothetical protein